MSKQPIVENITHYIFEINRIYKMGNATKHTCCGYEFITTALSDGLNIKKEDNS
jgi:hypothetical protein